MKGKKISPQIAAYNIVESYASTRYWVGYWTARLAVATGEEPIGTHEEEESDLHIWREANKRDRQEMLKLMEKLTRGKQ